jgi:hypothetical protein
MYIQCEEDKDVCPDVWVMVLRVTTKGLEGGKDEEEGSPAMVNGECEVNKESVGEVLWWMIFFDDVVYILLKRSVKVKSWATWMERCLQLRPG